jgi:hypothetical protein
MLVYLKLKAGGCQNGIYSITLDLGVPATPLGASQSEEVGARRGSVTGGVAHFPRGNPTA